MTIEPPDQFYGAGRNALAPPRSSAKRLKRPRLIIVTGEDSGPGASKPARKNCLRFNVILP